MALSLLGAPAGGPLLHTEDERSRLVGHTLEDTGHGARIADVAGEGAPLVGCVARRKLGLFLVSGETELLLEGPLAVPRIAGPNYKVWVIGKREGNRLAARRLGILARPGACTTDATPST